MKLEKDLFDDVIAYIIGEPGAMGANGIIECLNSTGEVFHIPTMPAFDFSSQPSVLRFPSLLEGGICHKFFPAFQPCVRGNECFMGSDNEYLVF